MAGSAAPTRAAQFCSGFLEAGWLAALVVVPLYYNPFSAGMFDYDKTAVLRALSLLMLAAWMALQAMRRTVNPRLRREENQQRRCRCRRKMMMQQQQQQQGGQDDR